MIRENVPLSACTTLRLGGPADFLAEPGSEAELQEALTWARERGLPVTVIGRGSNLLVRDGGIRGLVIRIAGSLGGLTVAGETLTAGAGAALTEVSRLAADRGLAGLSFAAGIPGSVGGGTVMNAGAYGGELCQTVVSVEGLRPDGTPFRYAAEELGFGYRESRLQHEEVLLTRVEMRLTPGDPEAIRAEMREFNRRRAEKQPLNLPSAGSTFKRPAGGFAAELIDRCGLKGLRIGGAQVSEKHAGFLVNLGGTAADFEALMNEVARRVLQETGVALTPEVRILGEAVRA